MLMLQPMSSAEATSSSLSEPSMRSFRWPTWLTFVLLIVSLSVLVGVSIRVGLSAALLVFACMLLLIVILFLFRALLSIDTHDETYVSDLESMNKVQASAAVERKRVALKAIQDLEYEKSIGNITDEDFTALMARSREEAKEAMRAVDEERKDKRNRAEQLAKHAIGKMFTNEAVTPSSAKPSNICKSCMIVNDIDARFCKQCGAKLNQSQSIHTEVQSKKKLS